MSDEQYKLKEIAEKFGHKKTKQKEIDFSTSEDFLFFVFNGLERPEIKKHLYQRLDLIEEHPNKPSRDSFDKTIDKYYKEGKIHRIAKGYYILQEGKIPYKDEVCVLTVLREVYLLKKPCQPIFIKKKLNHLMVDETVSSELSQLYRLKYITKEDGRYFYNKDFRKIFLKANPSFLTDGIENHIKEQEGENENNKNLFF